MPAERCSSEHLVNPCSSTTGAFRILLHQAEREIVTEAGGGQGIDWHKAQGRTAIRTRHVRPLTAVCVLL